MKMDKETAGPMVPLDSHFSLPQFVFICFMALLLIVIEQTLSSEDEHSKTSYDELAVIMLLAPIGVAVSLMNKKYQKGRKTKDITPPGSPRSPVIAVEQPSLLSEARRSNAELFKYAQAGDVAKAEQELFKIPLEKITTPQYSCVIQACTKAKDPERAEYWMTQMTKSGCEPSTYTFGSLIQAYARNSQVEEADGCLTRMKALDLQPNLFCYNSVLSACNGAGDAKRAESCFKQMIDESVHADEQTYSQIIATFGRLGEIDNAETWFRKLQDSGVEVSSRGYNAVIQAAEQVGDIKKMERLFNDMVQENITPSRFSYVLLIRANAKKACIDSMGKWTSLLQEDGFSVDAGIYSIYHSYLKMHFKQQNLATAEALVKQMLSAGFQVDSWVYSSLIEGLIKTGLAHRVEAWIQQLQRTECQKAASLYDLLLKNSSRSGDPSFAEKVLKWAQTDQKVKVGNWHYNQVLKAYIKAGDLASASQVLEQAAEKGLQPDVVGCTMLMHGHGKSGDIKGAEEWMNYMNKNEIQPSEVSYMTLINACVHSWNADRAEHWLSKMKDAGLQPSVYAYNSLITLNAKIATDEKSERIDSRRAFSKAEGLFAEMIKDNVTPSFQSYAPLIDASFKLKDLKHAETWMEKYMASGFEVNEDMASGFVMMIVAYAHAGHAAKADAWLSRMNEIGVMGKVGLWNSVMNAYARAYEPHRAAELFARMIEAGKKPNSNSYTILVNAWSWSGEGRRAEETLKNMKDAGCKASREIYITVLRALEHTPDAELVEGLLQEMDQDGLRRNEEFLSAQLRVYAAADPPLVEKAVSVFTEAVEHGIYPVESVMESLSWVVGETLAQDLKRGVGSKAFWTSDNNERTSSKNPWVVTAPPGLEE